MLQRGKKKNSELWGKFWRLVVYEFENVFRILLWRKCNQRICRVNFFLGISLQGWVVNVNYFDSHHNYDKKWKLSILKLNLFLPPQTTRGINYISLFNVTEVNIYSFECKWITWTTGRHLKRKFIGETIRISRFKLERILKIKG